MAAGFCTLLTPRGEFNVVTRIVPIAWSDPDGPQAYVTLIAFSDASGKEKGIKTARLRMQESI